MKIETIKLNQEYDLKESCACIGYFDGLHLGHRKLIEKCISLSKENKCESALITFLPDPQDVLTKQVHQHIQDFDTRLKLIAELEIDTCYVLDFDEEMASLSKKEFAEILKGLNLKSLVCGFDFSYAYKGEGDYYSLRQDCDFPIYQIEEVKYEDKKISSTWIKQCIKEGNMKLASKLLGYSFFMSGKVVSGFNNGTKLGFPTANIHLSAEQISPKYGVYIGAVNIDNKIYKAMINYGNNPTLNLNQEALMEIHILDYSGNLYGQELHFYLIDYLREEIKFNSLKELQNQLKEDNEKVRNSECEISFISGKM